MPSLTSHSVSTKFDYLKRNLHYMAELVLGQVLALCDMLENDSYEAASNIIAQDSLIDKLEKENRNISQSAILDAMATRHKMGVDAYGPKRFVKEDPLRFVLSSVRITIYLEQIGNNLVGIANSFAKKRLEKNFFYSCDLLDKATSQMATAVGMSVESLIEEKDRFFGSIQDVCKDLSTYCQNLLGFFSEEKSLTKVQFLDISSILFNMENIGDLSINVGEELVRLRAKPNHDAILRYFFHFI